MDSMYILLTDSVGGGTIFQIRIHLVADPDSAIFSKVAPDRTKKSCQVYYQCIYELQMKKFLLPLFHISILLGTGTVAPYLTVLK